jgi:(E)-4-hydroxy-3-methylbut-2-enyl-diphosphate synthase
MDLSLPILETPKVVLAASHTPRRKSRKVMVGGIAVGGGAPISVQTMTKTKTGDVKATLAQIKRAEEAGCDIVRVTVNDWEAAEAMHEIVRGSNIPIVADIHFNHVFAIKAIEARLPDRRSII